MERKPEPVSEFLSELKTCQNRLVDLKQAHDVLAEHLKRADADVDRLRTENAELKSKCAALEKALNTVHLAAQDTLKAAVSAMGTGS